MYKLIKNPMTNIVDVVNFIGNGYILSIPFDPANTDYQAYLKYKEEGGKVYSPDEEVPSGQTSK